MNKQKFNQIVQDQSRIGEKELIELVELSNDYPYSQVLHTLVAKGSHDQKLQSASSKLHKAAFYVTDRGVLKQVILSTSAPKTSQVSKSKSATKPKETKPEEAPGKKTIPPKPAKQTIPAKSASTSTPTVPKPDSQKVQPKAVAEKSYDTIESYDIKPADKTKLIEVPVEEKPLSEQVLESIAALKKAREQAQLQQELDGSKSQPEPKPKATRARESTTTKSSSTRSSTAKKARSKASTAKKTTTKAATSKTTQKRVDKSEDTVKGVTVEKKASTKKSTKADKISNKSTKASKTTKERSKTTKVPTAAKPSKKKASSEAKVPTKKILKSIKKTQPKDQVVGERQREQIEIIDRFIKEGGIKKPENPKGKTTEKDLSIDSVEFHENLVSENLAKIFTSQKQYEKAIDIYKKLIWKFPQKKSYFAAQIEELKKL